ncbi:peptidase C45 (plasmid) [Paraburkholderia sp. PGU19]|uniref:C45 family autoproteolytic acyltransferase/hydolase n=1 Tax=Paraburkholderia sp. PGU19 TaxID=2735434 RepID=UPI0015D9A523|nr:C45 family peptidase [Paraburkholderia sp. PGU19]BCG05152.1 peptidase C45 [Paraburkholderia sp. PGU19]
MQVLTPSVISGSPYDIGYELGSLARPVMSAYMGQSVAWQAVSQWRGNSFVRDLRQAAQSVFPDHVAEIEGMAAGMGWSAEDVFLWNCRGELIHNAPDGCTTLAARSSNERLIAHNEDGDPYLGDQCALVDVRPTGKPGFVSFYYPGSLPGHTFAMNRAGLVQAINNLRIRHPAVGVPRMVLTRAVLDVASLDAAVEVLNGVPRASGFHHTLGCVGDPRLLSIEATVQHCSVVEVPRLSGHTNHLIHDGCGNEEQIVTESSRDRQTRLGELLPALPGVGESSLLQVLFDQAPEGLPIYRDDPADPDDENTLATALFVIRDAGVELEVRQQGELRFKQFMPVNRGHTPGPDR